MAEQMVPEALKASVIDCSASTEDGWALMISARTYDHRGNATGEPMMNATYGFDGTRLFVSAPAVRDNKDRYDELLSEADTMAHEIATRWAGQWDTFQMPVYVRYGKLPKSGKSRNFATGQLEVGVSCIPAHCDPATGRMILDAPIQSTGIELAVNGTAAYAITGRQVGTGSDGEALVTDAQIIGELDEHFALR